jgi:type IV fimbrial biogenesis protein FimT
MKRHSGFTLIEIMVALAIFSILATIAVSGLVNWLPRQRLGAAARGILAAVEKARLAAIKQNTSIGLAFNNAGESYTVWIDNGDGGGVSDNAALDGTERTIMSGQMPAGIDLTAAAFGVDPRFRFNGMGIPIRTDDFPGGGAVTVANQNGDSRTVMVVRGGNSRIQ